MPAESPQLVLREVTNADLDVFFVYQSDPVAILLAAFTVVDPVDRVAFTARWARLLSDPTVLARTVEVAGRGVIGSVLSYEAEGRREVTYWLGRPHWGLGFGTRALQAFLTDVERHRPVHARVAVDHVASRRLLESCGFRAVGSGRGYAHGRGGEVDELLLVLGEVRGPHVA